MAKENKFFEKGWIPNNLVYESMTNIYLKNNLDLNSAYFSYNLSSFDLDNFKTKIHKMENPERIDFPNELSENMNKSEIFYTIENTDTTYISIDNKNKKIFGWNNNKE